MADPSLQHVLLTGLPRSGSSAFGALADALPDHLYLNSPEWHLSIALKVAAPLPFCKWLVGDYYWQHKLAFEGAQLTDYRHADGSPIFDGEHIIPTSPPNLVRFTRPELSPNFTLLMRHTTLYTAILQTLLNFEQFRVIAIVRNPVDVLLSWLAHPKLIPSPENPYGLSGLWPELHAVCTTNLQEIERLAQLVELFFQRYIEQRDFIEIVRYEDMVNEPMLVSAMFGNAALPANLSQLKNTTQHRQNNQLDAIREALHRCGTCWKAFYPDAL